MRKRTRDTCSSSGPMDSLHRQAFLQTCTRLLCLGPGQEVILSAVMRVACETVAQAGTQQNIVPSEAALNGQGCEQTELFPKITTEATRSLSNRRCPKKIATLGGACGFSGDPLCWEHQVSKSGVGWGAPCERRVVFFFFSKCNQTTKRSRPSQLSALRSVWRSTYELSKCNQTIPVDVLFIQPAVLMLENMLSAAQFMALPWCLDLSNPRFEAFKRAFVASAFIWWLQPTVTFTTRECEPVGWGPTKQGVRGMAPGQMQYLLCKGNLNTDDCEPSKFPSSAHLPFLFWLGGFAC